MKSLLSYLRIAIFPVMMAQMILHVHADEVFTRAQIHAMAIGNLQIDVDQETDSAILGLRLEETPTIGNPDWEALPLTESMVSVAEDGTLRLSVPAVGEAAFYRVVASKAEVEPYNMGEVVWIEETINGSAGYLSHPPIPGSVVIDGGSTVVYDHISALDDGNGKLITGQSVVGRIDYFSGSYGISNYCSTASAQYATYRDATLPSRVTETVSSSGRLSRKPCAGSVVITAKYTSSSRTFTYYGFDYLDGSLWGKRPHSNLSDLIGSINYIFGTFSITPYDLQQITISYVPEE